MLVKLDYDRIFTQSCDLGIDNIELAHKMGITAKELSNLLSRMKAGKSVYQRTAISIAQGLGLKVSDLQAVVKEVA